jgi:CBS domain-containing protein
MITRLPAILHPADTLESAMNVMNNTEETLLPVVDEDDPPKLLGSVEQRDVARRYTEALLQARREERGE